MAFRPRSDSVWYNLPGAIAAWQPVRAPDQLTARQNIVRDGRTAGEYKADGTLPAFSPLTGWEFSAGSSHYIDTGIVPDRNYSVFVRFSGGLSPNSAYLFGTQSYFVQNWDGTTFRYSLINSTFQTLGNLTAGVVGIVGNGYTNGKGYQNGRLDVSGLGNGSEPTWYTLFLGALNNAGTPANHLTANIQAAIVLDAPPSPDVVMMLSHQMAWCDVNPEWSAWGRRRKYYFTPPPPFVYQSPATLMDVAHQWQLLINGTDRYRSVLNGQLNWTENEAGEIGSLRATLQETGSALGIVEWQEVILQDGGTAVWGGYITGATPIADRMGNSNRLQWEISAESYATVLNRTRRIRKTYYGENPGDILVDLFNQAFDADSDPPNQTEFDTSTYVTTGSWPDAFTFAADGEKLTDILDRLALLAGYVWWIDADKAVHFGAASASTAPFGIKSAGAADYSSFFPPNANSVNARVDATEIRNSITVHGGVRVSAVVSDVFVGDGSTLVFHTTYSPIIEVISISVGGVMQSFGTDWYHSFSDYDCLVNYSHGTVRWDTGNAPPNLDNVIIAYRYGEQITVRVNDVASITAYGRTFSYEIVDRSISSEATATAVANAMLNEYAYGTLTGSLEVERLGIHAGQRLQIEHSALGLSGYYQVRQVATMIKPGGMVRCAVRFGGRRMRLSTALSGNQSGGPVTPSGQIADTPILTGRSSGALAGRDQQGLQLSVTDFGSAENDTAAGTGLPTFHIRWRNADGLALHRMEAWSDHTATGHDREVLRITSEPEVDKYMYSTYQVLSQQEAWMQLRAIGGWDLAGQQDASIHLYAYRGDGNWDHTRAYIETDTTRIKTYTGGAEPDPGTDSLPDGLLIYTDGTWNPGSGEGLYIRINGAWRPLAVAENARQYLDNSIDLESNSLFNIGGLHLKSAGTQTSSFNVVDAPGVVYPISTTSGNVTATLPALADVDAGAVFVFVKLTSDSNQMIIDGDGSETINGATTINKTAQWGAIWVYKRSTSWMTLNY